MRKIIIIVIVILFIISAIFFVNRFKFSFYKNVCGASVQKQFSEKYGLQTKLIYVDHNDNNFFGGEVMLETMDGVSVICDYNILGSMIGDSYVNMIYAYDDIKRVDQYVNKYFDNYNVIESFMMSSDLDDFYYEYYAVGEDSSSTYADYLMATKNHQRYLIIQLCEEHDLSGVEGLLDDLEKEFADQDNFTIFIKNYPEGLYSAYEECEIFTSHFKENPKYSIDFDALGVGVKKDYGPLYDFYVVGEYNFNGETKIIDNPLPADRGF